jgi:hypothetical protein
MTSEAPPAAKLVLSALELAMLQRNRAIRDSIEARKAVMFAESESKLRSFDEQLNSMITERLSIDPAKYEANLETGELTLKAP